MTIIHMGRLEGILKPSRIPVRIAEPSMMVVLSRRRINLAMAHSNNTQETMLVSSTTAAPRPKKYKLATKAGIKARHTPYIFFWMLSPE
jgi:hypothetical protein